MALTRSEEQPQIEELRMRLMKTVEEWARDRYEFHVETSDYQLTRMIVKMESHYVYISLWDVWRRI